MPTSQTLPVQTLDDSAFIQQLADLILRSNAEFENIWDITSRVCDQYAAETATVPSKWAATHTVATAA